MDSRVRILIWIVISMVCIQASLAASMFIQPNATIGKDSYLNEDKPNDNYATVSTFSVDSEESKPLHGIIQFNISEIPSNAIINSALFQIYLESASGADVNTQIKRLTNSWVESDVTWNVRDSLNSWTNPGGDYASTNYSVVATGVTSNVWVTYNITDLVKEWYNSTYDNYGMIIKPTYAPGNNEKKFSSSEGSTTSNRPKLLIQYELSPPLNVTLINPEDFAKFNTTNDINFTFEVHDSEATYNCSLYIDDAINKTNVSVLNNTETTFEVFNISYGHHEWYVECENYTSQIRDFSITELNKPYIQFISQTPDVVSSTYVFNDTVLLKYNATDDYLLSHVDVFYKTNNSLEDIWYFVNGIAYNNFKNIKGTNISINWSFELGDYIYPATYNYEQFEMENKTHEAMMVNNTKDLRINYLNVSKDIFYDFMEIMLNYTGSPSKLDFYYCNSSYLTGNYETSNNCAFLGDVTTSNYYDHIHNENSWHKLITLPIVNGKLNGIEVTSSSDIIIKGPDTGTWYVYGINETLRNGVTKDSINNGSTWDSINYTIDSHIHQFEEYEVMNYYACAYDYFNNENCTDVRTQFFNLTAIEPSGFEVTKPISGIYPTGTLLEILWSESTSPLNETLYYNLYLVNNLNTRQYNITQNLSSNPYYFDTTNISGIYKVEVEACSVGACLSEYSDLFQLTIGSFTPVIIVGGETYSVNDSYDAVIELNYADNPYIKANTSTRIGFDHLYNESDITDSILKFTVNNQTVDMSYSEVYGEYSVWLNFPLNETGDFQYTVEAINPAYETPIYTGTLTVRDYNFVRVALWQDCKWYQVWCSDQTKYKNRFGYVFATPVPDEREAYLNYTFANQLQPLKDFGIWGERVIGMNVSKLYRMGSKNFNAKYENGEALLFVPSNESYALSFFAANFILDNEDGYGYSYYTKKYTENLFLDMVRIDPEFDYNYEYYVTNYDLHKTHIWTFWILFGVIAMIGLIIIAFLMAFSPTHGLVALLVYFLLLPIIWLALKLIFWVITL